MDIYVSITVEMSGYDTTTMLKENPKLLHSVAEGIKPMMSSLLQNATGYMKDLVKNITDDSIKAVVGKDNSSVIVHIMPDSKVNPLAVYALLLPPSAGKTLDQIDEIGLANSLAELQPLIQKYSQVSSSALKVKDRNISMTAPILPKEPEKEPNIQAQDKNAKIADSAFQTGGFTVALFIAVVAALT